MIEKTKALVFHAIKYGDTSLITTCYTEISGIKSYMLKGVLKAKRAKLRPAYFQPLAQLEISANHNPKKNLHSIRDVALTYHYEQMYSDVKKQAITMFLSEVLYQSIREEESNPAMFSFIQTGLQWLDTHESISNFHLLFMLNLTKFLGFYPVQDNLSLSYFDLLNGCFVKTKNPHTISGIQLTLFKRILGINFDGIHEVSFRSNERQEVLDVLIQYFELHIEGFRKPKSLNVLKTIFE